jgi:hypothetical protein
MNAGDIYQKKDTPSVKVVVIETFTKRVPPPDSFDAAHDEEWDDVLFVRYKYTLSTMAFTERESKFLWEFEPAVDEGPPIEIPQYRSVGRLVMLDRGKAGEQNAVLVGGVLGSYAEMIQDPSKAELWEAEVIIRPIRKYRDFKDGNGATLEHILMTGLADEEMWREKEELR